MNKYLLQIINDYTTLHSFSVLERSIRHMNRISNTFYYDKCYTLNGAKIFMAGKRYRYLKYGNFPYWDWYIHSV